MEGPEKPLQRRAFDFAADTGGLAGYVELDPVWKSQKRRGMKEQTEISPVSAEHFLPLQRGVVTGSLFIFQARHISASIKIA